jgi:hypothetical protein
MAMSLAAVKIANAVNASPHCHNSPKSMMASK